MISLRNTFMTVYKGRLYPNYWDIVALLLALTVISLLAWNAKQMDVPYQLGQAIPISLEPSHLPGYALRTVLRMLIAMMFSLLFTFTFATWAAKSRRAARIIIPLIDIMQSVPILGFLSIAVVGFIALFPSSMLQENKIFLFSRLRHVGFRKKHSTQPTVSFSSNAQGAQKYTHHLQKETLKSTMNGHHPPPISDLSHSPHLAPNTRLL